MTLTHPERGRRRDPALHLPSGPDRVYPAFTYVEHLGECQTVRKLGRIAKADAHVRLVVHDRHGLIAVRKIKGLWILIGDPARRLTIEERSFHGRRARKLLLNV